MYMVILHYSDFGYCRGYVCAFLNVTFVCLQICHCVFRFCIFSACRMCTSFVKERVFHVLASLMLAMFAAFVLAAFNDNAFSAFAHLVLAVFVERVFPVFTDSVPAMFVCVAIANIALSAYTVFAVFIESKGGKDQGLIQSSTMPDPRHYMGKHKEISHTREP